MLCIDDLLSSIAFDSGVGISSAAVIKAEVGRVDRFAWLRLTSLP